MLVFKLLSRKGYLTTLFFFFQWFRKLKLSRFRIPSFFTTLPTRCVLLADWESFSSHTIALFTFLVLKLSAVMRVSKRPKLAFESIYWPLKDYTFPVYKSCLQILSWSLLVLSCPIIAMSWSLKAFALSCPVKLFFWILKSCLALKSFYL